jgi:hypothetical protein
LIEGTIAPEIPLPWWERTEEREPDRLHNNILVREIIK